MAFDNTTGLPNALLAEQLFTTDLGTEVENQESPKRISISRLEELFRPVLHKESIDVSWSNERQISEFFGSDAAYMAIAQNGQYSTLVSRLTVLNSVIKTLVKQKQQS